MKNCMYFPFFTNVFRSDMAKSTPGKNTFSTLFLLGAMLVSGGANGQTWIGTGANADWLTTSNWSTNQVPSSSSIALFTTANSTGNTVGIDMNTAGGNQQVGAIEFANSRTAPMTIGNSSTAVDGVLTLNGTTVNSISNVILRNNSNQLLTLQNTPTGSGTQKVGIALGNSTTNLVNINGTGNITIACIISGTNRQLSFNSGGSGMLILNGANTYSGGTVVSGGRLRIDAVAALPATGDILVQSGGRLTLNAGGTYGGVNQSLTLNPNQTAFPSLDSPTNTSATWQGTVAINADTRIEANGGNGSIIFSGAVSGSGALVKNGAGSLVLSSASNSLSGATQIFRGKLTVNSGSSMGTGDLTMSEAGFSTALELKNAAQTINSLSSSFSNVSGTLTQTITLTGTALTINQSANTTYGTGAVSTLTSIIAGTGSIIKSGTGTLTLTSANTYTGSTTINGGVIELNKIGGGTIPGTNNVNINNGGALKVSTNQTLNNIPVANGGTLNVEATLTVSGTLTNHGTINGAGTLIASGTFTNTGSIAPGNSVGTLSVTGNLTMGSGTYNCEINGASFYDVLAVSGNANLTGGALVVDWGSFTPVQGNVYTIMTYASATGTFASVTIPPVNGLIFNTNVNATSVTISVETVLPVELATFSGKANGQLVNLDWATSTEKNNACFYIDRAKDGVDFQAIGKVSGAGNSTETRNYSFTDAIPEAGVNFYRLRQVDFDGQFSYSKVVPVTVGKTANINLSPVPAQDQLQVNLETALRKDGTWQLLDYAGRLLQSGAIAAEAYGFTIDVAKLTRGAYILRLIDGQTVVTKQFQK